MSNESKTNQAALDTELRKQLLALLKGGQAHAGLDKAIDGFPVELRGAVPEGLPYSGWQLVEHLRIAQHDLLNFSAPPSGGYQPMEWPKDYWPSSAAPPSPEAWDRSVAAIRADRESFAALITRPESNLAKPFRWGNGQNLLREALLIADHNAYHTGQLIMLRRLLGAWES